MNMDVIEKYRGLFTNTSQYSEKYIKSHLPNLYKEIMSLPEDLSFKEKLYWVLHDIHDYPVCPVCGNRVNFNNLTHGYYKFCSLLCSNRSKEVIAKKEETSVKRYGVKHYSNPDKSKKTKLERYGDSGYTNMEKRKKTCLERYGAESNMMTPEFWEKSKQTKLEKYGDENYTNIEKCRKTCLERYGVESVMNTQEFQEKSRQTKLEKYGDENYNNHQKYIQTCLERYGVESNMMMPEFQQALIESRKEKIMKKYPNIISIDDDWNYTCKCSHKECDKCQDKTYRTNNVLMYYRQIYNMEQCTILNPITEIHTSATSIELFIQHILITHNIKFISNDRSVLGGHELDIYIPSHKLAIECNGIYWHSTNNNSSPSKHYKKYNDCLNKGIQLISIWEDQVVNHPDIVESIILSKLGIYDRKIYARKCDIREVPSDECNNFLNIHHLQGDIISKYRYGLYYNDELVSIMTFGRSRQYTGNNSDNYELHRYCCKSGALVVGGASKLFRYFMDRYNVSTIESFSSNDISNGNLYKQLGFIKKSESKSYWYVDRKYKRYHRYNFTKRKLVEMGYDSNLSEFQIMKSLGYYQIYDSGQTKWIYDINNPKKSQSE